MWSSYETCLGNATQDKRSGRRTAWATFDDFDKRNRTGHLLGGAPPKTGWADGGTHGRILTMARRRRQGVASGSPDGAQRNPGYKSKATPLAKGCHLGIAGKLAALSL